MTDPGAPLPTPEERELANQLHALVEAALEKGPIEPPGVLEAITAVVGAIIATRYVPDLRRPCFEAFSANTWSAVKGFEIYADQMRKTHTHDPKQS